MKKTIKILVWFTLTLNFYAFSQSSQRILIPKIAINNVEIPIDGHQSLQSMCLDRFRDAPKFNRPLNNILTGKNNVKIEYTDTHEFHSVGELISKGKIELQAGASYENVTIRNLTGHPIKCHINGDIQVGEHPESPVEMNGDYYDNFQVSSTGGISAQTLLWEHNSLKSFHDLGFALTGEDKQKIHDDNLGREHSDQLEKAEEIFVLSFKFRERYGLDMYPQEPFDKTFEDKFNEVYNTYLLNKKRLNDSQINHFSRYDIGIAGANGDDLLHNYLKAKSLPNGTKWEDIKVMVQEDYKKGRYYINDEYQDKYFAYIKSPKINGFLFKESDYVHRNLEGVEQALFQKKINYDHCHVLNFLAKSEDLKTYNRLKELFPNNNSDFSWTALKSLKESIRKNNIKYVFCFGHFKPGKIFTVVNGEEISMDIDELYHLGNLLNVEIFLIGCESSLASGGKTGTLIDVNSIKSLESLFSSLKSSNNLGDFFTHFTQANGTQYSFAYQTDENSGLVYVHVYERTNRENKTGTASNGNETGSYTLSPRLAFSFKLRYLGPIILQNNQDKDGNKRSTN